MVQSSKSRSGGQDEDKWEPAFQKYQEGRFYNMTAEVGLEGERGKDPHVLFETLIVYRIY